MVSKVLFLPEILAIIGSTLSKSDILICIRVCQTWHSSFYPLLFHNVALQEPTPRIPLQSLRQHAYLIKSLYCQGPLSASYYRLGAGCTNIQQLTLQFSTNSSPPLEGDQGDDVDESDHHASASELEIGKDALLCSLIRQNHGLSTLILCNLTRPCSIHFWTALAQSCPGLKVLHILGGDLVRIDDQLLLQHPPLTLSTQTYRVFLDAFWNACRSVKELDLQRMVITASLINHVPSSFSFTHPTAPSDPLPNLTRLVLIGVHVRELDLRNNGLFDMALIQACPNLEYLHWVHSTLLFPTEKVARLLKNGHGQKLKHLRVDGYLIKDEGIAKVLESMSELETLSYPAGEFGPLAMQALRRHYRTIKTLALLHTTGLTEENLQDIRDGCPNLVTLKYRPA